MHGYEDVLTPLALFTMDIDGVELDGDDFGLCIELPWSDALGAIMHGRELSELVLARSSEGSEIPPAGGQPLQLEFLGGVQFVLRDQAGGGQKLVVTARTSHFCAVAVALPDPEAPLVLMATHVIQLQQKKVLRCIFFEASSNAHRIMYPIPQLKLNGQSQVAFAGFKYHLDQPSPMITRRQLTVAAPEWNEEPANEPDTIVDLQTLGINGKSFMYAKPRQDFLIPPGATLVSLSARGNNQFGPVTIDLRRDVLELPNELVADIDYFPRGASGKTKNCPSSSEPAGPCVFNAVISPNCSLCGLLCCNAHDAVKSTIINVRFGKHFACMECQPIVCQPTAACQESHPVIVHSPGRLGIYVHDERANFRAMAIKSYALGSQIPHTVFVPYIGIYCPTQ